MNADETLTEENDTESKLTSDVGTVDEVAYMLRVNRKTVYDAVGRNEIPHRRIGRAIRFDLPAVRKWLAGEGRAPRSGRTP